MEEGLSRILKILFLLLVAIALLLAIYFFKDVLYEKTVGVKDIFSNMFSFS